VIKAGNDEYEKIKEFCQSCLKTNCVVELVYEIIPLAKSNGNFPPYLDYSHFNEILVGINAVKYNALEDMEWGFVDVKVNFSVIDSLQFSYPFMEMMKA